MTSDGSLTGRVADLADGALSAVGAPLALAGLYVGALSIPRRLALPAPADHVRIAVVVPAHNEAAIVATAVTSLLSTQYPAGRRRIIVVADNCTDQTADVARAAGAEVFERDDATRRGKGYALNFAFDRLLDEGWAEVVAVVDADTVVETNLLRSFAARFATGERAVQANYEVLNRDDTWRTRLMHIAFTAFHEVRGTGREALHLSAGLRGNGMAFSVSTLRAVPHRAFSVVEDLEYGVLLGLNGIRVAYAHESTVSGDMPTDADSSVSQRDRWERGRATIRKTYARKLILKALTKRSPMLADLAADVLMPPMSKVIVPAVVGMAASSATLLLGAQMSRRPRSPLVFGIAVAGLALNVAEGWRRSGTGLAGLADLAKVPTYVAWKARGRTAAGKTASKTDASQGIWIRTTRSHETTGSNSVVSVDPTEASPGADPLIVESTSLDTSNIEEPIHSYVNELSGSSRGA
jgi:1,2-diacylglycerol 3-beta-glucosyltransferase